jgi:hypothetical protein
MKLKLARKMAHKLKHDQEKRKSTAQEQQKLQQLAKDKKKVPTVHARSTISSSAGAVGRRAAQQGQKVPLTQWVDRTVTQRNINGVSTKGMTCTEMALAYVHAISNAKQLRQSWHIMSTTVWPVLRAVSMFYSLAVFSTYVAFATTPSALFLILDCLVELVFLMVRAPATRPHPPYYARSTGANLNTVRYETMHAKIVPSRRTPTPHARAGHCRIFSPWCL